MVNGVRPTNHAVHETIAIAQGWNDWFETGFYIFTSARSGSMRCDPLYRPLDHQSHHREKIQLEEDLMMGDAWL